MSEIENELVDEQVEEVNDEDEDEIIDEIKNTKRTVTKELVLEEIKAVIALTEKELSRLMKSMEKNKSTRILRAINKRLTIIEKHVPKIKRQTKPRVVDPNKPHQFEIPLPISNELADFAGVKRGSKLSREDVMCMLSTYIHFDEAKEKMAKWKHLNTTGRDLRNPSDKRIINPDAKLSKLLKYAQYCKDVGETKITTRKGEVVVDNALHYYTIMKLIQPHFIKNK